MLDTAAYLARIGYAGPTAPTLATLRALHHAQMLAVPFENLDIGLGRPIVPDEGALFAKIVGQRRGGFCYELNGLFAAPLRTLGFRVTLLSASVRANPTTEAPVFDQDYDHLCLRVDLDEPWLVDVGFGDSFLHPIRLAPATEQVDSGREEPLGTTPVEAIWSDHYRIVEAEPWRQLQRRDWRGGWQDRYRFTPTPRAWDDFVPDVPLPPDLAGVGLHPPPHLHRRHPHRARHGRRVAPGHHHRHGATGSNLHRRRGAGTGAPRILRHRPARSISTDNRQAVSQTRTLRNARRRRGHATRRHPQAGSAVAAGCHDSPGARRRSARRCE